MSSAISASDLGIHLTSNDDHELFKWLVASFLLGKRIQGRIAAEAYRVIVLKHQRDTSEKLAVCSHRDLVRMLGEARYNRYDESTADRLLKLTRKINSDYGGKVTRIRDGSESITEFEAHLKTFDGIGPKTVEIFMRDARSALF